MNENKRSIRLLTLTWALCLAMSSLLFANFTARAWAQDAEQTKHITEISFNLIGYESGKSVNGVQVGSQTENVFAESKKFLQADPDADAWKEATGTFASQSKYRVKITFSTKAGYDFAGLVKEKIKLETGETALEYDAANKAVTFELKRIPANHTLTFETNEGSAIAPVTKPENTIIDLTQYVPTKAGFKFVGWYGQAELTQKMDEVALGQDITVYAKWEKDETAAPDNTKPGNTQPDNAQPNTPGDPGDKQTPAPGSEPSTPGTADSAADSAAGSAAADSSASASSPAAKGVAPAKSKSAVSASQNTKAAAQLPATGSQSLLVVALSSALLAAGATLVISRKRDEISAC